MKFYPLLNRYQCKQMGKISASFRRETKSWGNEWRVISYMFFGDGSLYQFLNRDVSGRQTTHDFCSFTFNTQLIYLIWLYTNRKHESKLMIYVCCFTLLSYILIVSTNQNLWFLKLTALGYFLRRSPVLGNPWSMVFLYMIIVING